MDCGLVTSVKVARAGLPDGLAQPGSSPSICVGVRSASIIEAALAIGPGGDAAGEPHRNGAADALPGSRPRLVRAASSSVPCRRTSASASSRALRYSRLSRRAADLDVALELEALRCWRVARSIAASTFCPMIIRSAAKFVASTVTR